MYYLYAKLSLGFMAWGGIIGSDGLIELAL